MFMKGKYTIFTKRRDKERRNRSLPAEEVTTDTNGSAGEDENDGHIEANRWPRQSEQTARSRGEW